MLTVGTLAISHNFAGFSACHCNGHSDRRRFDMTACLASGGRSGGVGDDCPQNTEGQHCDRCRPLFSRDPLKAISDPYACIPTALPICDVYFQQQGDDFIIDKGNIILRKHQQSIQADEQNELGLIPQINSLKNFCSKQDLDEYQLHNCVEIASASGPQLGTATLQAQRAPCVTKYQDSARAVDRRLAALAIGAWLGYFGFPNCRPCLCNGLAELCDPKTGSCFNCGRFTTGRNCERCVDGYYGNPSSGQSRCPCPRPDVPSSSRYFAHSCYQNPWNYSCLQGYAGCSCHPSGVSPTECPPSGEACLCDPDTGTCPCLPSVTGQTCDHCADGYWNLVPGRGCQPCDCDPQTLLSSRCDQARNFQLPMLTGQCPCRSGYDGKRCSECEENHYEDPLGRCILVQGLIRLAANMEDKRETLPVCEADFKGLRENMSEIERIWRHPVFSSEEFSKVKDYHDSVRKQIMQLSEQLKTVDEFEDLKETILRMRNETNLLLENLQEGNDLHFGAWNASLINFSKDIKKYYQSSLSTEKKMNETTSIINNSKSTRNDLLSILDTLTSKEDLSLEKLQQIKIPNIQILQEKVCGEGEDTACARSSCGGPSCYGSPTLSRNALQKAQEAESVIHNLNNQVHRLKKQFVELQNQYAVLQHKMSTPGLTKETLGKVKQLKDAAVKLAGDTEDKMRRIADLEKKIQALNLSKQEKADQLKQLEDQVIAIKNEIVDQEDNYATCYS
ncbi:hypothetical protein G4228_011820 [Cervus hanglu yarkandensis]|nr:hypothetical protein G4228_011820 [Cervus hanglu yarkandensis]